MNRRSVTAKKPDVTVQVAVLAKSAEIKELLAARGYNVDTVEEVEQTATILPAHKLSVSSPGEFFDATTHLYKRLGPSIRPMCFRTRNVAVL